MKKIIFILVLFIQFFSYCQIIPIPDANFKSKLINADATNSTAAGYVIDINNNDEIEVSEAHQVTYLNVIISNISDLSGIEYFINLDHLYIQYNSISNINISTLSNLEVLRCDHNNLSSINLTGLNSLVGINFAYNYISGMNFSLAPNLNSLVCDNNQLSIIDLSQNPLLTKLYCKNNNLTSINIKNGINEDFSNINYNDCWKTGNPNLTTICADASEVASVQSFLDGCGTAQAITITSNCGLSNEEFASNVGVYPNPFADKLTIDTTQSLGEYNSITIYNTLGSVVFSNSILNSIYEIDLSNLPKGVYIANLKGETKKATLKLIKN